MDGPARQGPRQPLTEGLGLPAGDVGGECHHASLLKRRRFKTMIGMTRMNNRTATAAPTPNWRAAKAEVHISSAMTLASSRTDGGGRTRTISKILRTLMTRVMNTTITTGR